MAEECPKCGFSVPSIRLAEHVSRCKATQKLTGSSGMAARRRRGARITTAELESRRVTEYYQQLWKKEDEDLDDILREQGRKPKLRSPALTRRANRLRHPAVTPQLARRRSLP